MRSVTMMLKEIEMDQYEIASWKLIVLQSVIEGLLSMTIRKHDKTEKIDKLLV